MINKLVLETLGPVGIPVAFQKYWGKETTYITFHEYLASGEEHDEDEETYTGHFIQVDIWSKSDYTSRVGQVKSLMKAAGFKRLDEADLYEEDTGIYHKGIRFYYLEEQEVE